VTSSPPTAQPGVRPAPRDEPISRELADRFAVLSETCRKFSDDIYRRTTGLADRDVEETVRRNVSIARRFFEDGLVDVLAAIYYKKSVDVEDLVRILRPIKRTDLANKLRALEAGGLVERVGPLRSGQQPRYSLTHKGAVITRTGEPVILFLRLEAGPTAPTDSEGASAESRARQPH
jgi:HxlR-like helix-turn-helix